MAGLGQGHGQAMAGHGRPWQAMAGGPRLFFTAPAIVVYRAPIQAGIPTRKGSVGAIGGLEAYPYGLA